MRYAIVSSLISQNHLRGAFARISTVRFDHERNIITLDLADLFLITQKRRLPGFIGLVPPPALDKKVMELFYCN